MAFSISFRIGLKSFMPWANSEVSSVKTSAIPHILTPLVVLTARAPLPIPTATLLFSLMFLN